MSKKNTEKNNKSTKKSSKKADVKPEEKKSGAVVSLGQKSRHSVAKIDANEEGTALAEAIASDFSTEVAAGMSQNGRCHVTKFQHGKYDVVIMTFPNGRIMVKATLCENSIFNICSRVFVATDDNAAAHARRFARLAFLKEAHDKALQVPYMKSAKEAIEE